MKHIQQFTLSAVIGLASTAAFAAPAPKAKYEEMDYGRFLSASFNNTEGKPAFDKKGCATSKGIAIKLGANNEGAMVFDTDLMRMAGGWTDGFVKYKGVIFDGGHGPNPLPPEKAQIVFQTNPQSPGWSKGDNFSDPRKLPTGPGAAQIPFGPIPKEWAKYKGLYLHGDHVVLAYTVGTATVLEMPDFEKTGETTSIERVFNVLTRGNEAANLLVAEGSEGATATVENNIVALTDPKNPDARTFIAVTGAPAGAKWQIVPPARVELKLPVFAGNEAFKVVYWKGAAADQAKGQLASKTIANLREFTKGGPAHWAQTVTAKGEISKDETSPYVVDTVGIPSDNPYKSWIRIGGFDFFKDGRIAFSTWSGDVWIGTPADSKYESVTWHRFATGLFQALGLKIVDDQVYVLGRDQITRLHDLNNDGEADFYENFNNDVQVTPGFHEFTFDLKTDPEGNFYFVKGGPVNPGGRGWGPLSDHNGCMFKVSKDGQKFEVFATGLRTPNGMGVSPTGEITTGDNQGTWVPVDYIHFVKKGEFIEVPDLAHKETPPTEHGMHLCWVPYDWDNSNGDQVWVPDNNWGLAKNTMLYLSYGKCSLFRVLIDRFGKVEQGGVVKFPLKFDSGIMRSRFNPRDGQLYVAGLRGWQTTASKDSTIQRVRYTGKKVTMPDTLHVTDQGIHVRFTAPLDTSSASDAQNYSIEQYNYHWTHDYGSPEFSVADPTKKGHDQVEIKSVRVSPDRKEVFLEVPGLKPVDQMKIKMNIKDENGAAVPADIGNTINEVAKEDSH